MNGNDVMMGDVQYPNGKERKKTSSIALRISQDPSMPSIGAVPFARCVRVISGLRATVVFGPRPAAVVREDPLLVRRKHGRGVASETGK